MPKLLVLVQDLYKIYRFQTCLRGFMSSPAT